MMSRNSQLSNKDRSNNFSKEEANKLMLMLKAYPRITCKKTDHASNQQKDAAWKLLTENFNSDATRYRSSKQLQQKYNNLKKTARKEMAVEKYGRRQTGGGPAPPKPSETTEWLNSIMGESISGLPAVYDSDALDITDLPVDNDITANTNMDISENINEVECVLQNKPEKCEDQNTPLKKGIDNIGTTTEDLFDASTPRAMLRKPISKELYTGNKKMMRFTPLETRKHIILQSEKKIELIAQRQAREQQLVEYAKEEQEANMLYKKEAHEQAMLHREELHKIEIKYREELHQLVIEKSKYELEKAKLEFNKIN